MTWPLIAACFIIADVLLAGGLIAISLRLLWRPLHVTYPPQAPADDAVRRQFQSFTVGVLNLGYSIHVAVDENHLHLTPAKLLRWLGAKPASIPWEAIEFLKRSQFTRSATVRIGERRIAGPFWCLQLAEPDEDQEDENPHNGVSKPQSQ